MVDISEVFYILGTVVFVLFIIGFFVSIYYLYQIYKFIILSKYKLKAASKMVTASKYAVQAGVLKGILSVLNLRGGDKK